MRKTFNILYISALILAVSFWGDVVAAFNDAHYFATSEIIEKIDEEGKDVKSFVETFEKIEIGGQGGNDFDDEEILFVDSPLFSPNHYTPIVSSSIVYETTVLLKTYNHNLLNSLTFQPLYILYNCPKNHLV